MNEKNNFKERICNCIPSVDVEKDWILEDAVDSELMAMPVALPKAKDLRENWWEIGNQENTGSCVGWALADSVLRWHFTKKGLLSDDRMLSPRFIWMASKETDIFTHYPTTFIENSGTSLKAALDIARKFGAVNNVTLPFKPPKLFQGRPQTFFALASRLKIASYFSLKRNPQSWKKWIAFTGPILTRLDVDSEWYDATSKNGNLDKYIKDSANGGHAIALVGYTEDRFIVRNSWGTNWGDDGFGYASYEYAEEAFTEAYGVIV